MNKILSLLIVVFLLTGCFGGNNPNKDNYDISKQKETSVTEKSTTKVPEGSTTTKQPATVKEGPPQTLDSPYQNLDAYSIDKADLMLTVYEGPDYQFIFETYDVKENKVIDKIDLDKDVFGIVNMEGKERITELDLNLYNGEEIGYYMLTGDSFASSPGGLVIVSLNKSGEIIETTLSTEMDYLDSFDINNDGKDEILGQTIYGGQTSYDVGFCVIYTFTEGQYKPSYTLSKLYHEEQSRSLTRYLNENPTLENLDNALEACGYLGNETECEMLMKQYQELVDANTEELKNNPFDHFTNKWISMIQDYRGRWAYLKAAPIFEDLYNNGIASQDELTRTEAYNLDDDDDLEIVACFSSEDWTKYQKLYIIDPSEDGPDYYVLPTIEGYSVDDITSLSFGTTDMLYERITNGINPLGCRLSTYIDGKYEVVFHQMLPGGSGSILPVDQNNDGLYDYVQSYVSDYSVAFHGVGKYYQWDGTAFNHYQTSYRYEEAKAEATEVIAQYINYRWLEINIEATDVTLEMKKKLARTYNTDINKSWDQITYEFAKNAFSMKTADLSLSYESIGSDKKNPIYKVSNIEIPDAGSLYFHLTITENGLARITAITLER